MDGLKLQKDVTEEEITYPYINALKVKRNEKTKRSVQIYSWQNCLAVSMKTLSMHTEVENMMIGTLGTQKNETETLNYQKLRHISRQSAAGTLSPKICLYFTEF